MPMAMPTTYRLRRSIYGRVFGGTILQFGAVLVMAIFPIVLLRGNASHAHTSSSGTLTIGVCLAVAAVVWVVGLTAYAEIDGNGVRWRDFWPHAYAWEDIEEVAMVRNPWSISRARSQVQIRVRGRNRVIRPASLAGPNLVDFARVLGDLAGERGIPSRV